MKIAIISDVHGNVAALDAVLADAAARTVDQIVNLGDICSGGLFPAKTADRLMPLGLPTIRGNHERQVLDQPVELMGLSDRHAAENLRADQLAWARRIADVVAAGWQRAPCARTPDSDLTYFLETVTPKACASQ